MVVFANAPLVDLHQKHKANKLYCSIFAWQHPFTRGTKYRENLLFSRHLQAKPRENKVVSVAKDLAYKKTALLSALAA